MVGVFLSCSVPSLTRIIQTFLPKMNLALWLKCNNFYYYLFYLSSPMHDAQCSVTNSHWGQLGLQPAEWSHVWIVRNLETLCKPYRKARAGIEPRTSHKATFISKWATIMAPSCAYVVLNLNALQLLRDKYAFKHRESKQAWEFKASCILKPFEATLWTEYYLRPSWNLYGVYMPQANIQPHQAVSEFQWFI